MMHWLYRKLDRRKIYKSKGRGARKAWEPSEQGSGYPEWRRERRTEGQSGSWSLRPQSNSMESLCKTIFGGLITHHACGVPLSVSNSARPFCFLGYFSKWTPNQAFVSCDFSLQKHLPGLDPPYAPWCIPTLAGRSHEAQLIANVATGFRKRLAGTSSLKLEAWAVCSHGHRCAHTIINDEGNKHMAEVCRNLALSGAENIMRMDIVQMLNIKIQPPNKDSLYSLQMKGTNGFWSWFLYKLLRLSEWIFLFLESEGRVKLA